MSIRAVWLLSLAWTVRPHVLPGAGLFGAVCERSRERPRESAGASSEKQITVEGHFRVVGWLDGESYVVTVIGDVDSATVGPFAWGPWFGSMSASACW